MNIFIRPIVLLVALTFTHFAHGYEAGEFFLDPYVAVGVNQVQGTHVTGGLDLGYAISENLAAGLGGHYSAGESPSNDREIGGGPFLGYSTLLTDFLGMSLREEISYLDVLIPVTVAGEETHIREYGVVSSTSIGAHLIFTRNLGFTVGYRIVLGLSNNDIAQDRSGAFFGLSIGI